MTIIKYLTLKRVFNRFPFSSDQHVTRVMWEKSIQENWNFPGTEKLNKTEKI